MNLNFDSTRDLNFDSTRRLYPGNLVLVKVSMLVKRLNIPELISFFFAGQCSYC